MSGYKPSNGSEGRWFMDATCGQCTADHPWHPAWLGPFRWEQREPDDRKTCPILARSLLLGETVEEWSIEGGPKCTGFQGPCICPSIDPLTGLAS